MGGEQQGSDQECSREHGRRAAGKRSGVQQGAWGGVQQGSDQECSREHGGVQAATATATAAATEIGNAARECRGNAEGVQGECRGNAEECRGNAARGCLEGVSTAMCGGSVNIGGVTDRPTDPPTDPPACPASGPESPALFVVALPRVSHCD